MKKIAIIGAGGFGREVKMLIDQINHIEKKYEFIGFYDDNVESETIINGFEVIGTINELIQIDYNLEVIISIADPRIKRKIYEKLNNYNFLHFPTLIHPNVLIGADEVNLGYGCIICASNIITINISIGNFVILNLGCTVGHDTKIGDYCSFMPSVNISGEVEIGSGVYFGTGAKIINQITIGEGTIVGAGAVVSKSLPPNCTAVGRPAKPIKYNYEK
jgi:sugar O-acyltransferase (sialic acid O-acetyltransferase NeuD family)